MIAEALRYADDPNAPRVEGSAGRRRRRRHAGGQRDLGRPDPPGADDRRLLHDPVRRRRRPADRPGFLFGGYEIVGAYGEIAVNNTLFNLPDPEALGLDHALFDSGFFAYLGALFFIIGKTAFMFFVPALAGYIAYAIADRPGIAPGFVMGGLAANLFDVTDGRQPGRLPATGFLGAIVGGVLAGVRRALDRRLEGAGLGPRPDAGAGHPAAHLDHRRPGDDHRARQAIGADRRSSTTG